MGGAGGQGGAGSFGGGSGGTGGSAPKCVVKRVDAGAAHTCAIIAPAGGSGDALHCWGSNSNQQLGIGSVAKSVATPSKVSLPGAPTLVASGASHTCASVGGKEVFCWGSNYDGQVGAATAPTTVSTPVPTSKPLVATALAAGAQHTCAAASGLIYCWGSRLYGQVGDGILGGPSATSPVPASQIFPGGVLVAGIGHTCRLDGGGMQCWGAGQYGQLGDGGINHQPKAVSTQAVWGGVPPTNADAGGAHTCAVAGGLVYCWGSNSSGQSDPKLVGGMVLSPTVVMKGTKVALGTSHSCVLDPGQSVICWGDNAHYQLGKSALSSVFTSAIAVTAGANHTCAIKSDDTLWCWGANESGQLGRGVAGSDDAVPAQVTFTCP